MEAPTQPENQAEAKKVAYDKGGIFRHIATAGAEETQIPGRLTLEEIGGEAHVEWSPVRTTNCADDEQGWALIQESAGDEKDEEYSHLVMNFKLEDVAAVTRTEAVLELPRVHIEFKTDADAVTLYFHSTAPVEFWQCINRYLILTRSPSNANTYRVEGKTDALAQSLYSLNFSPDESQGIVSNYFSGSSEVLGGFSRVTQFVRNQLGLGDATAEGEEIEEIHIPATSGQAEDQSLVLSEVRSLQIAGTAESAGDGPSNSLGAAAESSLLARSACPLSSLADSGEATPLQSVAVPTARGDCVVVSEPTSSLTQQSLAAHRVATPASSGDDVQELMFESACSDLIPEEAALSPQTGSLKTERCRTPSPVPVTEPGATLMDLEDFFTREDPVSVEEWKTHLDSQGRVRNVPQLHRRIFKGGLTPEARPIAWKFLLGYHDYNATRQERDQHVARRREQYYALQHQWQSMFPEQLKRFSLMDSRLEIIGKDVIRTDRTHPKFAAAGSPYLVSLDNILRSYIMFNFNLGYIQGMSDLLAPILEVLDDEVDAFWCFSGLMDKMEQNFVEDLLGMRVQLERLLVLLRVIDPHLVQHFEKTDSHNMFFCFRWMLVNFKREFLFDDVKRLWEVFWSKYLSTNFELFLAAAILTQQRQTIMKNNMGTNEIITHINGLAEEMDVDMMLVEAERICRDLLAKPANTLPPELRAILPTREEIELQEASV